MYFMSAAKEFRFGDSNFYCIVVTGHHWRRNKIIIREASGIPDHDIKKTGEGAGWC